MIQNFKYAIWVPIANTSPFRFFFKNKGFRENFEPKSFQGTHPFWVHQADQMAKILIFGQKTVLAEISVTRHNKPFEDHCIPGNENLL